jgi:hypothetical protein
MNPDQPHSPNLVKATTISLLVALIVLVTVVLPSEYGLDPLGTGEFLGLSGLSRSGPQAVSPEQDGFKSDRIQVELAPFESMEYKYRIEQGSGVVFSWTATGEVIFDFHAEPDGAEPGYAESFEQGRGLVSHGTYIAPFPGIHGWFWENRGAAPVVVELVTSGFFDHAIEFRDGDQSRHDLQPARSSIRP